MKKTPLYDTHVRLGARMVDFHGFLMPLQYTGIIEEHLCVRNSAGILDLSHMGEIEVSGKCALLYLQKLVTNDMGRLIDGEALYTPICNEHGGIVDDVIVYRLSKEKFLLVTNCANTTKGLEWMLKIRHLFGGKKHAEQEVEVIDKSNETILIAIQGPLSESILGEIIADDIAQLKRFDIKEFKTNNTSTLISRTGYTGEDGFEMFLHPKDAKRIWDLLLFVGKKYGLKPVGLGARDTLRLEAGLLLYGNDIDETTSPIEAGIGWTVKFDKGNFIGREVLLTKKINGIKRRLVGLEMLDRGIPRTGCPIVNTITQHHGQTSLSVPPDSIGKVTSGTYSPSTKKNIGLGYVEVGYSKIGTTIGIRIRDNVYNAIVVKTPFYKR